MRTILNLNQKWAFRKGEGAPPTAIDPTWDFVNLPHTWNAIDGQDGDNDYFRGAAYYAKPLQKADLPPASQYYLELKGANASAQVLLNGQLLGEHHGGYSTWRVDLTPALQEENLLVIRVDNGPRPDVYPQMADFTFYGGLYRDVNLICVGEQHFDLTYYGGSGIMVTPKIEGKNALVTVEVFLNGANSGHTLRYTLCEADGTPAVTLTTKQSKAELPLQNARLWQGRKDPYLYTAVAELLEGDEVQDAVCTPFGCRTFAVDPEKGFLLNGELYPLRGVSRHQDRQGVGNALLPQHHEEDMDFICEVGATALRLAHYQHAEYFYDLCDQKGLIVWAEIPYISKHLPAGRENTLSQMQELVVQNYNHPSIAIWGLSNEIGIGGSSEDLLENHRLLNDLCHRLDPTRLTAVAAVSMCNPGDPYLQIPDLVAYNHYFGWYGGETGQNGPWFDAFHKQFPHVPIGCSEYGCEALNWHTDEPRQGDYTEEYQAHYHEELIKQFFTRPYLWATYVWNMFDFGADARNEGGENGQNHKGLVTFDRKYKKDAFYAYKAWLSKEPFVHICGKRYTHRHEPRTKVTVYSNQPEVELFANGVSLGKKAAADHFFYFEVPNKGETHLTAVAGDCQDHSVIYKVAEFWEGYRLREKGAVLNWFDVTEPSGFLSLNHKVSEILATPEGKKLFLELTQTYLTDQIAPAGFEVGPELMQSMGGFTLLRLLTLMGGMANLKFTKEQLLTLNRQLNQIPTP